MLDAIELLKRYASTSGKSRYYEATDTVPLDGVVPKSWRHAVIDDRGRVERLPYELCVLVALRDAIRRREVFIDDARRWRDPDHDLPADFEASKDLHYESLRQPTDRRPSSTTCVNAWSSHSPGSTGRSPTTRAVGRGS